MAQAGSSKTNVKAGLLHAWASTVFLIAEQNGKALGICSVPKGVLACMTFRGIRVGQTYTQARRLSA